MKNSTKIGIGIIILAVLFYSVGIQDIANVLKNFQPAFIPLILAVFIINLLIGAFNLRFLLQQENFNMPFASFSKYFFMNTAVGTLLPGKVGTFAIVFLLKKKGMSYGKGMSVLVIDKIITLAISGIIGVLGISIILKGAFSVEASILILLAIPLLLFLFFHSSARNFVRKYILREHAKIFTGFSATIKSYLKNHRSALAINATITVFRTFMGAVLAYLVFLSLGVNISIVTLWAIWGIEFVIALIPITLNGLGTRESAALYLFSILGINSAVVLAKYTINLLLLYGLTLLALYLFDTKKFMKEAQN